LRKARPRHNALGAEFLTAPGAYDEIRRSLDHLLRAYDTVPGRALMSTIGEDVDAASDLDKLRNPPNSRNQPIVPFLKEYFWPLR
jgi:hypothetical protein